VLLARDEVVVMDMEAGIEHLARGTAAAMDKLIVVVEPGRRSIDTARNIERLASEIGVKNIFLLGNKIRGKEDETFLRKHASGFDWLGFIPYDDAIIKADLGGMSPYATDTEAKALVWDMVHSLVDEASLKQTHSHEHTHLHSHEHSHGDLVHSHKHEHFHVHVHSHGHDYSFLEGHTHGEDEHGSDHTHDGEHGPHDHEHEDSKVS
jgi:hypothetical protein